MREREREREHRERDRYGGERGYDDRRNEERASKRPRRDDNYERPRFREENEKRGDSKAGSDGATQVRTSSKALERTMLIIQMTRPSTADTEEDAQKARLSKVDAWKKKRQLEKQGGEGMASPAGDNSGAASPAVTSPPADTSIDRRQGEENGDEAWVPTKRFDPKAIAKRASAAMEREKQKATLGSNVAIPKPASQATSANAKPARFFKATNMDVANGEFVHTSLLEIRSLTCTAGTSSSMSSAKISGFGLSTSTADTKDKSTATKTVAPLEEEEEVARKLEKLPDVPNQVNTRGSARADDSDDRDEGNDMRSDEEEAEALRVDAQKRAEEVQAQSNNDVAMANAEADRDSPDNMDEDEDIDPLDAFMNDLGQAPQSNLPVGKSGNKPKKVVFDSDDEGPYLDAMDDDTEAVIAAAAAKKRKKNELPPVDHAKMNYEPFRKNFYSESVELSEMTSEDVDILRADLDNIKCRGVNVPKPITKWSQGGFGSQILDVIREQKFEKPTSIQSQALPAIMSGRDIIGVAKTGSGKTMAFILPMFRHIKDQRPLKNLEGPIGVIIAPTRELALQIHRDCKPYLRALGLRAVCAYGGGGIKDQIAELKRGAEIIVCTAGRMIDLLQANSGRVLNLARTTYLVLDEADRMFDMGFEPQITRILSRIRPERQTVLFSATFPKTMEALARKALTKPIEIIVGGRSVVAPEITQIIEVRPESAKFKRALHLLGELFKEDDVRCLIFVERQETADGLLKEFLNAGYPTGSIHGGREQIDRDQAINDFKAGVFSILIATSVAARGLDVKQLKLVINYDSPNHVEDYVHRSGRTGRAGNTGTAVTFVTPEQDRFAPFLVRALTDSKQEIPQPLADLAKAHQEKVKSGEAKKISSGFGGHGIERLEAARDAEKAAMKKQYKTEDDPDDEEEDNKEKGKTNKEVEKLIAKAGGTVKEREPATAESNLPANLADHLNNAMRVKKAEPPAPKTTGGRQNGSKGQDALTRAMAAANSINSRIGPKSKSHTQLKGAKAPLPTRRTAGAASRPSVPTDNRGPDAGAFHSILEINDFPQSARWKVTNRTNVARILEATGTSITSKGEYYALGKEPEHGQAPKLYILVEGDTEVAVQRAMGDLTGLLRQGTLEAMEKEASAPAGGRYKV